MSTLHATQQADQRPGPHWMAWHRRGPARHKAMQEDNHGEQKTPDGVLSGAKDPGALPCDKGCCEWAIRQGIDQCPNPGIVWGEYQVCHGCQISPLHIEALLPDAMPIIETDQGQRSQVSRASVDTFNLQHDAGQLLGQESGLT